MPTRIIDLDEVLTPDKKVILAGKTRVLTGDAPIEMVKPHQALVDAGAIDHTAAAEMYGDVLRLFRHKKPTLESVPLHRYQLVNLIRLVYIVGSDSNEPISLDAIGDQEPKRVRLAGKTYDLPPDIPVELWLRVSRYMAGGATETETVTGLYEATLELFRTADPKLAELKINLGTLIRALAQIYNPAADADPPPKRARPSRAKATTGKTSPGASTSKQRRA